MICFVILMVSHYNIGSAKKQADKTLLAAKVSDFYEEAEKIEWAQIALGKVVVATEDRAWLYQLQSAEDRFAHPMEVVGNFATTKKLLDTAIAAAKYAVKSDIRPPTLTLSRWIWRLAGAYHQTSPVPNLMKDAAKGFAANSRFDLEAWALEKAEDEKGHDLLA